MKSRATFLLLSCAWFGAVGCSRQTVPECFPVRGQVSFRGKPIAEATVVLHPLSGDIGGVHKPIAFTAADGTFEFTTMKKGDGAPLGKYAITFELHAAQTLGEEVVRNGPNLLPDKYSRPDSSGQKLTVEARENIVPAINLL